MRVVWYSRSELQKPTVQPPFNVQVKRYSFDVYGGPRECDAYIQYPGGINLSALWQMIEYLRCGVEVYDWRGARVWWGFLDKVTINDGVRSFGIALDNMFNKVKCTYELLPVGGVTGLRADTAWYEDTISSGIYGTKQKIYSMTSYSTAAAVADAQARLAVAKYPVAITELASVVDQAITVEFLFSGWWKILNWIYYANVSTANATIANQLIYMAEYQTEFVESADCRATATTLASEFRQGDELLLDEIKKLLETGSDNGRRILVTVDPFRRVHFYEQPAKRPSNFAAFQYFLDTKNRLYNSMGGLIEPSECRVGVWAQLRGYELVNGLERITSPSPVFIERAIYDAETDEYQPESYGYKSPFDELQGIQR